MMPARTTVVRGMKTFQRDRKCTLLRDGRQIVSLRAIETMNSQGRNMSTVRQQIRRLEGEGGVPGARTGRSCRPLVR